MQMGEKAGIYEERHLKWWPTPSWIYYFFSILVTWFISISN